MTGPGTPPNRNGWTWDGEQWRPPGAVPGQPQPGAAPPRPSGSPPPSSTPNPEQGAGSAGWGQPGQGPILPSQWGPPVGSSPQWGDDIQFVGDQGSRWPRRLGVLVVAAIVVLVAHQLLTNASTQATTSPTPTPTARAHTSPTPDVEPSPTFTATGDATVLPAVVGTPASHDYSGGYVTTVGGAPAPGNEDFAITTEDGSVVETLTDAAGGTVTSSVTTIYTIESDGLHLASERTVAGGLTTSCTPLGDSVAIPSHYTATTTTQTVLTCSQNGAVIGTLTESTAVVGGGDITLGDANERCVEILRTIRNAPAGGTPVSTTDAMLFDAVDGVMVQDTSYTETNGKWQQVVATLSEAPQPAVS